MLGTKQNYPTQRGKAEGYSPDPHSVSELTVANGKRTLGLEDWGSDRGTPRAWSCLSRTEEVAQHQRDVTHIRLNHRGSAT
jgi:hypothetical protein